MAGQKQNVANDKPRLNLEVGEVMRTGIQTWGINTTPLSSQSLVFPFNEKAKNSYLQSIKVIPQDTQQAREGQWMDLEEQTANYNRSIMLGALWKLSPLIFKTTLIGKGH